MFFQGKYCKKAILAYFKRIRLANSFTFLVLTVIIWEVGISRRVQSKQTTKNFYIKRRRSLFFRQKWPNPPNRTMSVIYRRTRNCRCQLGLGAEQLAVESIVVSHWAKFCNGLWYCVKIRKDWFIFCKISDIGYQHSILLHNIFHCSIPILRDNIRNPLDLHCYNNKILSSCRMTHLK